MMRKSAETLRRQWELLMNIPAYPAWRSTPDLHERMVDLDHQVSIRTIQRDLDWLSALFPITSREEGKTLNWQWMSQAKGLEIPGMSRPTALVFQQVNRYLRNLMPPSILEFLEPYFQRANDTLAHSQLANWQDKVMHIEKGPGLTPPEIDPQVREVVYEALLDGYRFEADYAPRYETKTDTYEVNPLGIVTREGVIYLVCTLWDYTDTRQLAIHRIKSAKLLEKKSHSIEDFDLEKYVHQQSAFGYPESQKTIKLRALFDEGAAWHLTERKLSNDQVLAKKKSGMYQLTATVKDTLELRWWLLGFGNGVEILTPKSLRHEFRDIASSLIKIYS